jgi:hypothetical protein
MPHASNLQVSLVAVVEASVSVFSRVREWMNCIINSLSHTACHYASARWCRPSGHNDHVCCDRFLHKPPHFNYSLRTRNRIGLGILIDTIDEELHRSTSCVVRQTPGFFKPDLAWLSAIVIHSIVVGYAEIRHRFRYTFLI